jgi:hypothetical protein
VKLKNSDTETLSVSREVLEEDGSVTRNNIMKGFQGIQRGREGWCAAVFKFDENYCEGNSMQII